jgi:MATE family multidrug resistance protein
MSMMGITFNVHALCFFAAHGLSGAASARVGNDLGAARPRRAWLTVQAAVLMGTVAMAAAAVLLMAGRARLGALFSSDAAVVALTATAVPPLAASLVGEGANTVLSGVMRGCGRQRIGAAVNLVTYWAVGLPLSCALAFRGGLGALGLWTGLACTASVQALLMTLTVFTFDWAAESARARALVASGDLVLEDLDDGDDDGDGYGGGGGALLGGGGGGGGGVGGGGGGSGGGGSVAVGIPPSPRLGGVGGVGALEVEGGGGGGGGGGSSGGGGGGGGLPAALLVGRGRRVSRSSGGIGLGSLP